MNPEAAERWIEDLDVFGERYGLERIRGLLGALGEPQGCAPAVHVVGSNGKSSTARFAAAALGCAGLRVGAYLSPHVTGWHERIEVDGAPIAPRRFAAAVSAVREAADTLSEPVTQFEVLTAAALTAFARAGLDAMVVEAGLGGRYDATNVFDGAALVALTRIDLEHTDLLGETTAEIAEEKLAVVHPGAPALVTGPLEADVQRAAERRAAATGVPQLRFGEDFGWADSAGGGISVRTPWAAHERLALAVHGDFQRDNLAVGLTAAEGLCDRPVPSGPLRERVAELGFAGRVEVISTEPLVVADGAHNPAGAGALARALAGLLGDRRAVLVTSVLRDKDLDGILAALSAHVSAVLATRSSHARARPAREIAASAAALGLPARVEADPASALAAARLLAGAGGAIVIAGSLYLIEDLRRCGALGDG